MKVPKAVKFSEGGSWVWDPQQCMNDDRNITAGVNLAEPHYSDNKSYSDRCGSFLKEPYT